MMNLTVLNKYNTVQCLLFVNMMCYNFKYETKVENDAAKTVDNRYKKY